MAKIKEINKNILSLIVILIFVLVLMAILTPNEARGFTAYFSVLNFKSILFLFPEYGILTYGMMMCMISGGIDLSLVGIGNFTGVIAATILVHMGAKDAGAGAIAVAIIAAMAIGALCGLFNGFMIGYLKVPPMLVTLCGLQLYNGAALAITKGPAIKGLPDAYIQIANGGIGGIVPYTLPIFIVVTIIVAFLLKNTTFGQKVYYLGSNATASKYSGINNLKITMLTYMISGILGAISGVLMTSHYGSGKSNYGASYTLRSLLIVVLGGIHPDGGRGRVIGVTLAIIVLQVIASAFAILKINTNITDLVYGLILIAALIFNNLSELRASRS